MKTISTYVRRHFYSKVLMYLTGLFGFGAFIVLISEIALPFKEEMLWRLVSLALCIVAFFLSSFFWKLSEEYEDEIKYLILREKQKGVFSEKMRNLLK